MEKQEALLAWLKHDRLFNFRIHTMLVNILRHHPLQRGCRMPPLELVIINYGLGEVYPFPIVDLKKAGKFAREGIWKHRKDPLVIEDGKRMLRRHTIPGPPNA